MKPKIIIVEDDKDLQQIFRSVLQKAGFDIVIFSDGRKLIEADQLADLFILDIELPFHTGEELCKHLKSRKATRRIPVFMVSAHAGLINIAKDVCADDYLGKPFDVQILISKVKGLLNHRE